MTQITRRSFLKAGAGLAGALAFPVGTSGRAYAQPAMMRRGRLRPYVQALPVPGDGIVVATQSAPGAYTFTQREIARQLHPDLPSTPIWAYDDGSGLSGQAGSFGMAIAAVSGTPLTVHYTHALPDDYPDWLPVDTRLTPFGTKVRLMTHLHGGFVAGDSDGNPAATPSGYGRGQTQTAFYPNQAGEQPATLSWFHDHSVGTTRLNVFAGLAAAYVIRDEYDTGTPDNANAFPTGRYEIPLVIQDRMFGEDGTFFYPTSDIAGVPWIGEYFGDVMLVNGKVWPYVDVEPRLYRLRILNGCNSRIVTLDLGGPPIWQLGAEGGLFDAVVPMRQLVLAPAERADVLVDFSRFANARIPLHNHRLQRPMSNPAPMLETVMQFRVGARVTDASNGIVPTTIAGGRRAELPSPVVRRFITLNEVEPEEPAWVLNMNARAFDATSTSEMPRVGTVEEWTYVNLTADTHPMHTHLVTFQVVGRTPFDVERYADSYETHSGVPGGIDPTPFATGPMEPPAPEERGFKDTVKANPGYFTTIRARFDLPAGVSAPQKYVHHCHIVEHEDNDMMQAFVVTP